MQDKFNLLPGPERTGVEALCQAFKAGGFECWLVGGSVRDIMLGKSPKDFDFASNAPLPEISKMFKKVILTGEAHGTVTVGLGGEFYEVTRFRKDVATDGRRATVEFAETIEEDLSRRDFTVNAVAFDPLDGRVVDPFHGILDGRYARLKFVGDLKARILEDHLRALRFVRFQVGKFGLSASQEDFDQVVEFFDESVLSQERINDEVGKIFAKKIDFGPVGTIPARHMLKSLGLFKRFFQGQDGDARWEVAIEQMGKLQDMFPMAVHVARFNKSPKAISSLLKLSSNYKDEFLLFEKMADFDLSKRAQLKAFLNEVYKSGIKDYMDCVRMVSRLIHFRAGMEEMSLSESQMGTVLLEKISHANEPFAISHLRVNGGDLIELLGLEGPEIGKALQVVLEAVWKDPSLNSNSFKSTIKLWRLIEKA